MALNIKKLKTEINETALELIALKRILRESGQPRVTYKTHVDRKALKHHATVLCSLRAHCRGKIHLRGLTVEQQYELVRKACEEYQLGESQEAAA